MQTRPSQSQQAEGDAQREASWWRTEQGPPGGARGQGVTQGCTKVVTIRSLTTVREATVRMVCLEHIACKTFSTQQVTQQNAFMSQISHIQTLHAKMHEVPRRNLSKPFDRQAHPNCPVLARHLTHLSPSATTRLSVERGNIALIELRIL